MTPDPDVPLPAHGLPFDPTYGCDALALRAITPPPEPDDFAGFWRATFAEAQRVPASTEERPAEFADTRHAWSIVRFTVLGGHRVGAWLAWPRMPPRRALVVGHGYGGRGAPDPVPDDAAAIFPCAPGFELSAAPGLPATSETHVVHGIASRGTYLIRACVATVWAAVSLLLARDPRLAGRVAYAGGSFGGGLGALAVPWDRRIVRAFLDVPTFGHHPLRLRCPCVGSGEAVRRLHATRPGIAGVLAYYDAAVAARRIAVPTLVSPARFDPAVPPPGQFAVANAIPGARIVERVAGHFAWPGEAAENARLAEATDAFLAG